MLDFNQRLLDLQRLGRLSADDDKDGSDAPFERTLRRISAIGKYGTNGTSSPVQSKTKPQAEPVFIGLAGRMIPISFQVVCSDGRMEFSSGTWTTAANQSLPTRWQMLHAALSVTYPSVSAEASVPKLSFPATWRCGLALGSPSSEGELRSELGTHLDRLIHAVGIGQWGFLVLAVPVSPTTVHAYRGNLLDELEGVSRVVHGHGGAGSAPEPGAEHYMSVVKKTLEMYSSGVAVGMWRVGVYLFGDPVSYYRLAGVWPGIFAGEDSVPDSVRVIDDVRALKWTAEWLLPRTKALQEFAGDFKHPLAYQSLITSSQVAAYCTLPTHEVLGLRVRKIHRLDVEPPSRGTDAVRIGRIVRDPFDHAANLPEQSAAERFDDYAIDPAAIREHVFVAGATGTGKTNTVFSLMHALATWKVPFLVIEPAKAEYRRLLQCDWARSLQPCVYTPGNENDKPLRLNPFEVLGGKRLAVGVHIDLLRSVFNASFGLWSPLPEILERCIHEIYADAGWDAVSNLNHRLTDKDQITGAEFPTLTDLVNKVEEVIANLGYEKETSDRMRAALLTRLNSLRTGAKGEMLDCQASTDMNEFLSRATVLELEHMGSDDDRAFVMGLLIVRLVEYLKARGPTNELRQVLIVEEAHRLLGNVTGARDQEQGDPRAKAVESFSNLLAEVRAFGLSIIIADQSPSALAPSVMRNTNLKISHRLLPADERNAMAGAMGLPDGESGFFSSIPNHYATVFAKGDDRPILIKLDKLKPDVDVPAVPLLESSGSRQRQLSKSLAMDTDCQHRFGRLVFALAERSDFVTEALEDLTGLISQRCPRDIALAELLLATILECASLFARRRGRQFGWSYRQTESFLTALVSRLKDVVSTGDDLRIKSAFSEKYDELFVRNFDPFPSCGSICNKELTGSCRYRYAIADTLPFAETGIAEFMAKLSGLGEEQEGWRNLWSSCAAAVSELTMDSEAWRGPGDNRNKIFLCFAQQMLAAHRSRHSKLILDQMIATE